jgi:hypothetical protein
MSEFVKNDHHKQTSENSVAGQCQVIKSDGKQCNAYAGHESLYCFIHDPQRKEERQAAQKKGGKERSRKAAVLPSDTPDKPLETAQDVAKVLAETINQLRRGELDHRICNSLGCLTGYLLKAQELGQIERRLAKLESVHAPKWANPNVTSPTEAESVTFDFAKARPEVKI